MNRTILASLGLAIVAPALAGAPAVESHAFKPPRHTVFLGDAKVFEDIRARDPARYGKIQEILRVAEKEPCETLPKVIKTRLDLNADCQAFVVYTSFPPKTLLNFTIEDTMYTAYVVQASFGQAKLDPAR